MQKCAGAQGRSGRFPANSHVSYKASVCLSIVRAERSPARLLGPAERAGDRGDHCDGEQPAGLVITDRPSLTLAHVSSSSRACRVCAGCGISSGSRPQRSYHQAHSGAASVVIGRFKRPGSRRSVSPVCELQGCVVRDRGTSRLGHAQGMIEGPSDPWSLGPFRSRQCLPVAVSRCRRREAWGQAGRC